MLPPLSRRSSGARARCQGSRTSPICRGRLRRKQIGDGSFGYRRSRRPARGWVFSLSASPARFSVPVSRTLVAESARPAMRCHHGAGGGAEPRSARRSGISGRRGTVFRQLLIQKSASLAVALLGKNPFVQKFSQPRFFDADKVMANTLLLLLFYRPPRSAQVC